MCISLGLTENLFSHYNRGKTINKRKAATEISPRLTSKMWKQFKLSAYFMKTTSQVHFFCKSGPCSNSFSPHMLQLKQWSWPASLPAAWHSKEMLTRARGQEKQGGTLASEQPTQAKSGEPEKARGLLFFLFFLAT